MQFFHHLLSESEVEMPTKACYWTIDGA